MSKQKLPPELRGKYVTRSAFTKMQMERDRLKRDIHTLVMMRPGCEEVFKKWRKEFQFWKDIQEGLRDIAKKELPRLQEMYGTKAKLDSNPGAFK